MENKKETKIVYTEEEEESWCDEKCEKEEGCVKCNPFAYAEWEEIQRALLITKAFSTEL